MKTLSVCMIVKNEQEVLARCLDCVKNFADEIIIIDTGSKDKTKEIASKYTKNVFDFPWCDDFALARNFSFSRASGDYLMWIDADDIIPLEEQEKIKSLKTTLNENYSPNVFMCPYVANTDKKGTPTFWYYRERIIKNGAGLFWQEPVHECITPNGQVEYTDIKIYHKKIRVNKPKRNLKIYQKLEREKKGFSPRALYYYGRELNYNKFYTKSNRILKLFLDSDGWLENKIDACDTMHNNFLALKDITNAKKSLLNSFLYDTPRSKICCELAKIYQNEENYSIAKFWYKQALNAPEKTNGWVEKEYSTFVPAIELCVCCYKLGEFKSALYYHNISKKYAPDSPAVIQNEKFFNSL